MSSQRHTTAVESRGRSALRGPLIGARWVLLRLYRARLPRPHPGRACRVACSRARAAAPSAGVYQTVKRSARACPLLTYLLLPFRDLKLSHLAERAKRTPKGSLFATRANRRAFQRQRGRVDWRRWGIMKRGRRTGRH